MGPVLGQEDYLNEIFKKRAINSGFIHRARTLTGVDWQNSVETPIQNRQTQLFWVFSVEDGEILL